MNTIYIRGISDKTKIGLEELQKKYNYPSLNSYLIDLLDRIVYQDGLTDWERKILDEEEKYAEIIKNNTDMLSELLEFIAEQEIKKREEDEK